MSLAGQVIGASGLGVLLIALVKSSRQSGPVLGGGLSAMGMLGGLFTVASPSVPKFFSLTQQFTRTVGSCSAGRRPWRAATRQT